MIIRPLVPLAILVCGLATGWLVGRGGSVNPQEDRLLANLYMITGAEYRACCLQTYRWAAERLDRKLKSRAATGKPPAVVMDLDETVFDNGNFQTVLYRDRLVYKDDYWAPWERNFALEIRLVPGAREFIRHAEAAGVRVVYMSNRLEKSSKAIEAALANLKLNTDDIGNRLLLKDQSSDKTSRRAKAEERYDVLMYVGDNLRDFDEVFKVDSGTTIDGRKQLVDDRAARLGDDWIILPNCSYGEWERLLGDKPADRLPPTAMPNPAISK